MIFEVTVQMCTLLARPYMCVIDENSVKHRFCGVLEGVLSPSKERNHWRLHNCLRISREADWILEVQPIRSLRNSQSVKNSTNDSDPYMEKF